MKLPTQHLIILLLLSFSLNAQDYSISGLVIDQNSCEPLYGAKVSLVNAEVNAYSNQQGIFKFSKLNPGDYQLKVSYLGYTNSIVEVEAKRNSETPIELKLEPKSYQLKDVNLNANGSLINTSISLFDMTVQPVKSSQDILRIVPGLFIAQHAGGGKAEQIFLRGFDIDHGTDIALSLDGTPINMVSHAHGQGYSDLHFIIPETVEKVEFNKGPYYTEQGNFNTAGYASFQTKKNLESNLIKIEGGQFGRLRTLGMFNLLDPKKQNKSKLYLASEFVRSDGYFESPQNFKRFNSFLKFQQILGSNQLLETTLSAFNSSWNASGQIPIRAVESGMITRFGAIDDTEGGETQRFAFNSKLTTQIDYKSSLSNQIFINKSNFKLLSNFTFFLENPVLGDQITQSENRITYGSNNSYTRSNSISGLDGKLKAGINLRRDVVNDSRLFRSSNEFGELNDISRGDIEETNLQFYVQEDIKLSQRLRFLAGLRYDYFLFDYSDKLNNSNTFEGEAQLSPKFQLSYDLNENLNLYTKYGLGYHSNDSRLITGNNRNNRLAQAQGFDIGTYWRPNEKVLINMAVWNLDLEDELVYVGDEGIVESSGATRRMGLDFSMRYQLLEYLSGTIDANYAFARSKNSPKGENYIPLAPSFSSLGKLSFFKNNFTASIQYRYIADRAANENNSLRAEGYILNDLNLKYDLGKVSFGISIENLWNTEWKEAQFETTSRLQNETKAVTEIHYTPGTPFQGLASISVKF
mgnify:CR=1 FL=1